MLRFAQAPFNWDYGPQDLPRSSAPLVHYLVHHLSPGSSSSPWSLSATWSPPSDSRHLHLSLCCFTPSHRSSLSLLSCQPYQSPAMPRKQRGTSRRRRGRHARLEGHIPLSSQASNNGFDLEILEEVQRIVSNWEGELSSVLGAAGRTVERRQNEWVLKNLLARLVLRFNPLVPPRSAPPVPPPMAPQETTPLGPQPVLPHASPCPHDTLAPPPNSIPPPHLRPSSSSA